MLALAGLRTCGFLYRLRHQDSSREKLVDQRLKRAHKTWPEGLEKVTAMRKHLGRSFDSKFLRLKLPIRWNRKDANRRAVAQGHVKRNRADSAVDRGIVYTVECQLGSLTLQAEGTLNVAGVGTRPNCCRLVVSRFLSY
jgi:hypothetical protein